MLHSFHLKQFMQKYIWFSFFCVFYISYIYFILHFLHKKKSKIQVDTMRQWEKYIKCRRFYLRLGLAVNYYILIFKHTIWEFGLRIPIYIYFYFVVFLIFLLLLIFLFVLKANEKVFAKAEKIYLFSQHLRICGLLDCKKEKKIYIYV